MPFDAVLKTPQVVERVERMRAEDEKFRAALLACSRVEANVVVTDFRGLSEIPIGNRFLVYTLFPEATISVRLQWGPRREAVMATVGHASSSRAGSTPSPSTSEWCSCRMKPCGVSLRHVHRCALA